MSTAMMSAPSVASRTACDRPCPRAAPVMKATLPSSFPATFVTPFTSATTISVANPESAPAARSGRRSEAGQRALVAGAIRSQAGRPASDRHWYRTRPVRMIAERPGRGGLGGRRERLLAMPLDALGVGAVQRQPGEELGRHAPAPA